MAQTTALVLAEKTTAIKVFSADGGLDPIIQEAKDFVSGFEHDLSTGAGRKRTASLAAKVAKLKVRLDDMGKDLVSDWKAKSKSVDQSRKAMRDDLDALKVEARKPLTDWEEEEARIREETRAKLEAKRVADEIEAGHEMALLMNEKVDRDAAEYRAEVERQRQIIADLAAKDQAEREERMKQEAAENARIEAENKANAEILRLQKEKRAADHAQAKAEQDAKDAENRAIQQAKQAEADRIAAEQRAKDQAAEAERQRIAAEERAKIQEQERIRAAAQAKEEARLEAERAEARRKESEERARNQEIQRQKDEEARVKREQEAREANKAHKGAINRQAVANLMEYAKLTETQAKDVVTSLAKRQIASVTINY